MGPKVSGKQMRMRRQAGDIEVSIEVFFCSFAV